MVSIPKIKLNVGRIMKRGDDITGLISYESDIRGWGYITDRKEVLVVTAQQGYLRMDQHQLELMLEELRWIYEDNDRFGSK